MWSDPEMPFLTAQTPSDTQIASSRLRESLFCSDCSLNLKKLKGLYGEQEATWLKHRGGVDGKEGGVWGVQGDLGPCPEAEGVCVSVLLSRVYHLLHLQRPCSQPVYLLGWVTTDHNYFTCIWGHREASR